MANLIAALQRRLPRTDTRQTVALVPSWNKEEASKPLSDFKDYVENGYYKNGALFATQRARSRLFTQAVFKFQRMRNGRPGDLFGNPALRLLEEPWPMGTTGDMLNRMLQDADLAGNAYLYLAELGTFQRLRPDWVTTIWSEDLARIVGYGYWPGGQTAGNDPVVINIEEMVHWAPIPDPLSPWRGMSWVTAVSRDIVGSDKMQTHKNRFFDNAATPNLILKFQGTLNDKQRELLRSEFAREHEGTDNVGKTLYLENGADVMLVGSHFEQMQFTELSAEDEVRIAAAGGVPPMIVGISKGIEASTYSNYQQAFRMLVDLTVWDLWDSVVASIAHVVDVPADARLAIDVRDIPALQQDNKDQAEIDGVDARSIRSLTDAGFTAESAVAAVLASNFSLLVHSGLFSVQLQPPGSSHHDDEEDEEDALDG